MPETSKDGLSSASGPAFDSARLDGVVVSLANARIVVAQPIEHPANQPNIELTGSILPSIPSHKYPSSLTVVNNNSGELSNTSGNLEGKSSFLATCWEIDFDLSSYLTEYKYQRDGSIPWGRVEFSSEVSREEVARAEPEKNRILVNPEIIEQIAKIPKKGNFDKLQSDYALLRQKLQAESFLLDLALNERFYCNSQPLHSMHTYAIESRFYDSARKRPELARQIAKQIENNEKPVFTGSQSITAWIDLAKNKITEWLFGSNPKNEIGQSSSIINLADEKSMFNKVMELLSGFDVFNTNRNRYIFLGEHFSDIRSAVESAVKQVRQEYNLPDYNGSAIEYVQRIIATEPFDNQFIRKAILEAEVFYGRPLHKGIEEVRSTFGRYPRVYQRVAEALQSQNLWQGAEPSSVEIAVCGAGFNEEPISLAIIMAESQKALGSSKEYMVNVLSAPGFALEKLKANSEYPFKYSKSAVTRGLQSIFPNSHEEILECYFDFKGEDELVPKELLLKHIRYYQFEIGKDITLPDELKGNCQLLTIHNVFQYVAPKIDQPEIGDDFEKNLRQSLQAITELLVQDGRLSLITESEINARTKANLDIISSIKSL